MTVSFVLPTYNEKDNIVKIINGIIRSIKNLHYTYEVIVVDDNSPDRTAELCRKFFLRKRRVRVFVRKNNRGLASAIYYGISKSKGNIIFVMDTDFSHDPALIPTMLAKIRKYDIVIGSRFVKNGGGENKKRYFMSKLYNVYLRNLLRIDMTDFLFGYFCIKKKFLLENNLLNNSIFTGFGDYFIRLAYNINKVNGRFLEIPAFYKNRTYGMSKSNIAKMFFTYTKTSLELFFGE